MEFRQPVNSRFKLGVSIFSRGQLPQAEAVKWRRQEDNKNPPKNGSFVKTYNLRLILAPKLSPRFDSWLFPFIVGMCLNWFLNMGLQAISRRPLKSLLRASSLV